MIFRFAASTPIGTTRLAPKRTPMKMDVGIIHQLEITFPPGPSGELHVSVWHGGHQVWPSNPGAWFKGDGSTIRFNEYEELHPGGDSMDLYTYNTDPDHSHEVLVRLGVLLETEMSPIARVSWALKKLVKRLGA